MGRGLRRKDKVGTHKNACDFTLYDSADSYFKAGRLKKAASQTPLKKFINSEEEENESIYETNEESYDFEENKFIEVKDLNIKTKLHLTQKLGNSKDQYNVYPMDIWFLIGLYIWPESVGRFAAICQATHIVSHSAIFWRNLYARFYSKNAELPDELRVECMGKLDGLRTRVIRSLYWLYTPYILKQKQIGICDFDVEYLEGKQCVLTWYKQTGKHWHFYFKFCRKGSKCELRKISDAKKISRYAKFEIDIFHNNDENLCILDVITESYIAIPIVIGQWLNHCSLTVGYKFQFHCIKMSFNSQNFHSFRNKDNPGTLIKLDPVLDVRLYKWWNQSYQ